MLGVREEIHRQGPVPEAMTDPSGWGNIASRWRAVVKRGTMTEPIDFIINILDRAFQLRNQDAMHRAELFRDRFLAEAAWMAKLSSPEAERLAGHAISSAIKVDSLIKKHRNRKLNGTGGPTAETLCQPFKLDPLEKLRLSGELADHHVAKGRRIAKIYEAITSSVHARGSKLTSAGRASMTWRDNTPHWASEAYSAQFKPWAADMRRKKLNLPLVIDLVIFSISIREARKKYRMGRAKIVNILRTAIEGFPRA